ncbi:hypothetical protein BaRGS_00029371, partial [Batillaria attramentaria]
CASVDFATPKRRCRLFERTNTRRVRHTDRSKTNSPQPVSARGAIIMADTQVTELHRCRPILLCALLLTAAVGWYGVSGSNGIVKGSSDSVLQILWMAPKDPVMEGVRHVISASSSVGSLALALDKVQRENLVPDRVIK